MSGVAISTGNSIDARTLLVSLTRAGILFHVEHGLDASKAASPVVGQVYVAEDTRVVYVCFTAGAWVALGLHNYARSMLHVAAGNAGDNVFFTFTLNANELPPGRTLAVWCDGTWENSTGAPIDPAFGIKLSGVGNPITLPSVPNGTSGVWYFYALLSSVDATNQKLYQRCWWITTGNAQYVYEKSEDRAANTAANVTVTVRDSWLAPPTSCFCERARAWLVP